MTVAVGQIVSILVLAAGCTPTTAIVAPAPSALAPIVAIAPAESSDPVAATEASAFPPLPHPSSAPVAAVRHDCHDGSTPRLCVAPGETTGALVGQGACRNAPRQDVCRSCRPMFSGLEHGQCCYEGLSRLPACTDL